MEQFSKTEVKLLRVLHVFFLRLGKSWFVRGFDCAFPSGNYNIVDFCNSGDYRKCIF